MAVKRIVDVVLVNWIENNPKRILLLSICYFYTTTQYARMLL